MTALEEFPDCPVLGESKKTTHSLSEEMELEFGLTKAARVFRKSTGRGELDKEISNKYKSSKHSHGLEFVPLPTNQIGKPNNL